MPVSSHDTNAKTGPESSEQLTGVAVPGSKIRSSDLWSDQHIRLQVTGNGSSFEQVLEQPFARIGSHSRSDLVLTGSGVNRRHLYLHATKTGIFCIDFEAGAKAGRQIGYWTSPDTPIPIGPYQLFASLSLEGTSQPVCDPNWNADPIPGIFPIGKFKIENGSKPKSVRFQFRKHLTTIGSSRANRVPIRSAKLSDFHCVIYREELDTWVVDLLSSWSVIHRRQPVDVARISYESRVLLGNVVLQFGFLKKAIDNGFLREKIFPNSSAAPGSGQKTDAPSVSDMTDFELTDDTTVSLENQERPDLEQQPASGKSELADLRAQLATREQELDLRDAELRIQKEKSRDYQVVVDLDKKQLDEVQSRLAEQELLLAELQRDISNRESARQANEKEQIDQRERLAQAEFRIAGLDNQIAIRESELAELRSQLATREQELDLRDAELRIQIEKSRDYQIVVDLDKKQLAQAQSRLAEQELLLAEMQRDISYRESARQANEKGQIDQRERLAQTEFRIAGLDKQIAIRESELAELRTRLATREQERVLRDEELLIQLEKSRDSLDVVHREKQQLGELHAANRVQLAETQARLAEQELLLAEMQRDISDRESARQVYEKEQNDQRERLAQAEFRIAGLDNQIAIRESELADLRTRLATREQKLALRDAELRIQIEKSRDYQVVVERERQQLCEAHAAETNALMKEHAAVSSVAAIQEESHVARILYLERQLAAVESQNTVLTEQLAVELSSRESEEISHAARAAAGSEGENSARRHSELESFADELKQREAELEAAKHRLDLARRSFEVDLNVQLAQVSVLTNLKSLKREKRWYYRFWNPISRLFRGD